MLAAYIADSMEETMQPYTDSDDFLQSRKVINKRISALRSAIPEPQQRELNSLLNMIDNANTEYVEKAYTTGVVYGVRLRDEVITK
jgi:hypothetical protein